ncbi:MAG: clostripain-related cysteine peptidase [Elusimicrobia bacterium]|nr:clostripain-related cysteine peptidase [Elusimicrobiota bacterium]
MFKRTGIFAALIVFTGVFAAAADFGAGDLGRDINNQEVVVPAPASPETGGKPSEAKEWTIIIYLNGKNELEPNAFLNLNQMEMAGSSDKVSIVVEFGRMAVYGPPNGGWKSTRRYLIKKDDDTRNFTSPVVQDIGRTDMGDYKNVIAFGNWAKAAYPASHYMLIIWNHGSGWEKSFKAGAARGISYDAETRNHITTPQMGMLLKEIGGVDVYGSDACLMQMAEVDYELKDYAQYIVGSEETEPSDGYSYDTFLAPLIAYPAMTPEELGRLAVDSYSDYYVQQNKDVTQSLVRSAAIGDLLKLSDDFTAAVIASGDKALVKKAVNEAQSYSTSANKDLFDFVDIIVKGTGSAAVAQKGRDLQAHISKNLVTHNRFVNDSCAGSHGIAVYLPGYDFNTDYKELAWAMASRWDEFINWYQQP